MAKIEKLSAWHRSQVGTRESGVNRVRYNAVYYGYDVEGGNYDWCAAYIWCGFYETGLGAAFLGGGKSAYCPYIMDWARAHGRWVTGDYREGDLLLYDWHADGVPDHIGYCLSWDGTFAVAVEGNASDQVMTVRRPKGQIQGAYRPEYGDDDNGDDMGAGGADSVVSADGGAVLPELTRGARGAFVLILQRRLMALGYELPQWGADGEMGIETEYALRALQYDRDLEVDGICGEQSWGAVLDGGAE